MAPCPISIQTPCYLARLVIFGHVTSATKSIPLALLFQNPPTPFIRYSGSAAAPLPRMGTDRPCVPSGGSGRTNPTPILSRHVSPCPSCLGHAPRSSQTSQPRTVNPKQRRQLDASVAYSAGNQPRVGSCAKPRKADLRSFFRTHAPRYGRHPLYSLGVPSAPLHQRSSTFHQLALR